PAGGVGAAPRLGLAVGEQHAARRGVAFGVPEELANAVLEDLQTTGHRDVVGELAEGVVVQIRTGGPEADQRGGAIIAGTVAGGIVVVVVAELVGITAIVAIRVI